MDGREALAQAFEAMVTARGWSQAEVTAHGGPSSTTQTKVRTDRGPLSRQTLKQLDRVMGWPAGTAHRVAQGAIPAPAAGLTIEAASTPPAPPYDTGDLMFQRPDGLTDDEWMHLKAETGEWLTWQIERVRRRGSRPRSSGALGGGSVSGTQAGRSWSAL